METFRDVPGCCNCYIIVRSIRRPMSASLGTLSLQLSVLSFLKRLGVEAAVAGHLAAEEVPLQKVEVAAELLGRTVESEH